MALARFKANRILFIRRLFWHEMVKTKGMNRRGFLRLLWLAPAGIAVAPTILQNMAVSQWWPWRPVQWWQKKFDFGSSIGITIQATNVVTGEARRNGVRAFVHGNVANAMARVVPASKKRLLGWVATLNGPFEPEDPGIDGDEILEGYEERLWETAWLLCGIGIGISWFETWKHRT